MKKLAPLFFLLQIAILTQPVKIKLGIDVLAENNFKELEGKRVGLITNPTGVNNSLKHTIDILFNAKNINLVALFGPEHGVRGEYAAGDKVENYTDKTTHLPVYSLYGKTRKPNSEMLKGIDALVFDIQDIGCRSYTYISTMGLAMEAAAENNIEFIVLDRPNPLGGEKIEGCVVEEGYFSFVSQFKIPYVHGLTVGELALLLNGEKMLKGEVQCKLQVIPMKGWRRNMSFTETGLQWVPTSPHIPHDDSPKYYVSSGVLGELGVISEGVGYTLPFQVFAAEWIDANLLSQKMNELGLAGIEFRPITFKPFYGKKKDVTLHGVQLHFYDYKKVNLMSLQFYFMQMHNELYPEKNPFLLADSSRFGMFDKVVGNPKVREIFSRSMKYSDIESILNKDIKSFYELSKKYFIYN